MIVAFLGVDPRSLPAWMVYLGRISYGLYVYHGFALNITNRFPLSATRSSTASRSLLPFDLLTFGIDGVAKIVCCVLIPPRNGRRVWG
jgi:peptidoglycan/LPS O-acetylase OafA/YrhL